MLDTLDTLGTSDIVDTLDALDTLLFCLLGIAIYSAAALVAP